MSFEDKTINCSDCGVDFTFSASEQEFFANKGFTNEPKRCPDCRSARKAQRNGNAGYGGGNSYGNSSSQRQMFPATCADCGKSTEVPFEPRGDKPVYCSDCYRKVRATQVGIEQDSTGWNPPARIYFRMLPGIICRCHSESYLRHSFLFTNFSFYQFH